MATAGGLSVCRDTGVSWRRHLSFKYFASISGFRREVHEICARLEYYVACHGNYLPTFPDNISGPVFKGQEIFLHSLTLEDWTNGLSRNVGKELLTHAT